MTHPPEILMFRPDRPVVPLSGGAEIIRFNWTVLSTGPTRVVFRSRDDGAEVNVTGHRSLTIALMTRRLGAHLFELDVDNRDGSVYAKASVSVQPARRHPQTQHSGKALGPYRKLGLQPDATDAEVKAAHRKLAMQSHPDHGGDPDVFRDVQEAYQILAKGQQPSCYGKGLRRCVHSGCWRCRREPSLQQRPSYRPVSIMEEIFEMMEPGVFTRRSDDFFGGERNNTQEINDLFRDLANRAIMDEDL